mmetsp:Transcript_1825/g.3984  ORF Transcript_1825/g.3984 Transcript_1825/m.3984 type:complete len:344 (-) Transcript_1825:1914-2945(-)
MQISALLHQFLVRRHQPLLHLFSLCLILDKLLALLAERALQLFNLRHQRLGSLLLFFQSHLNLLELLFLRRDQVRHFLLLALCLRRLRLQCRHLRAQRQRLRVMRDTRVFLNLLVLVKFGDHEIFFHQKFFLVFDFFLQFLTARDQLSLFSRRLFHLFVLLRQDLLQTFHPSLHRHLFHPLLLHLLPNIAQHLLELFCLFLLPAQSCKLLLQSSPQTFLLLVLRHHLLPQLLRFAAPSPCPHKRQQHPQPQPLPSMRAELLLPPASLKSQAPGEQRARSGDVGDGKVSSPQPQRPRLALPGHEAPGGEDELVVDEVKLFSVLADCKQLLLLLLDRLPPRLKCF